MIGCQLRNISQTCSHLSNSSRKDFDRAATHVSTLNSIAGHTILVHDGHTMMFN